MADVHPAATSCHESVLLALDFTQVVAYGVASYDIAAHPVTWRCLLICGWLVRMGSGIGKAAVPQTPRYFGKPHRGPMHLRKSPQPTHCQRVCDDLSGCVRGLVIRIPGRQLDGEQ